MKAWATLILFLVMVGSAVGQVSCDFIGDDHLSCSDGTSANRFGDDWNFSDGSSVIRMGDHVQIHLATTPTPSVPDPEANARAAANAAAAKANADANAAAVSAVGAAVAVAAVTGIVYTIEWAVQRHQRKEEARAEEAFRLSAIKACETLVGSEQDPDPRLVAQFKIASSQDFGECAQVMYHNKQAVNAFRGLHAMNWKIQNASNQPGGAQAICAVGLTMGRSDRRFGAFTLDDLQHEWDTIERNGYRSPEARGVLSLDEAEVICATR